MGESEFCLRSILAAFWHFLQQGFDRLQFFAKAGSAFLLENFLRLLEESVQKKVAADFSAATFFRIETKTCYPAAPTLGRHLSNLTSSLFKISIQNIPVVAKTRMPTKTLSVWKVAPATVIMKPIPAVAA